MVKNATVFARIEPDVKKQAEEVFEKLGLPASAAINMFYRQVIAYQGLPFQARVPAHPLDMDLMDSAQIEAEVAHARAQAAVGETYDIDEVFDGILEGLNHDV